MNFYVYLLLLPIAMIVASKPNIVLILMDDLGISDIGYYGSDIETQTIDQLARNGIRLNYHYAENVCSATRSALLSGRYVWKTGLDDVIGLPSAQGTDISFDLVSDILSNKGYDTLFVGKWHIGSSTHNQLPHSRGFKQSLYFTHGQTNYTKHEYCANWQLAISTGMASGEIEDGSLLLSMLNDTLPNGLCGYDLWFDNHNSYINYDMNDYIEDIFAEKIKTFLDIRQNQNNKDPFFIYWSMPTPHTPITIPPQTNIECEQLIGEIRKRHCNMLYYADLLINDMVEDLKNKHLYHDTLIIFLSDNGAQPPLPLPGLGESAGQPLPFRGAKHNVFEGGIRTAALLSGGYLQKKYVTNLKFGVNGCDYNNLVYVSDFYAMIAGIADIDINNDIDGINLWQDIEKECNLKHFNKNKLINKRDEIISYRLSEDNMFYRAYVRTDEYKLLINPNNMGNPQYGQALDFLENWVNYDTMYYLQPNEEYYNLYNDFDKNNFNQNIFYSACYEKYLNNPSVNNINTSAYVDENNNKIYLFQIKQDNIEACNIAADNINIVNHLLNKLTDTMYLYDGSGGIYGEKGAYVAMTDSYDCNHKTFFYDTWANDPLYTNINDNWNDIFLSMIDKTESCPN